MRHGNFAAAVRVVTILILCAATACGGEDAALPGAKQGTAIANAPGSTTFARKLGGAGDEHPLGLATAADGSVVALSTIAASGSFPTALGMTRMDAAGRTLWARTFPIGDEVVVEGVAVTPEFGNVFVGLQRSHVREGVVDVGGGAVVDSAVVKFGPGGNFVWQRSVQGLTGIAVDRNGSVVVGSERLGRPLVSKYLWHGDLAWEASPLSTIGVGGPEVAFDDSGSVIATSGLMVSKYAGDGTPLWSTGLNTPSGGIVERVGTTALGTVVIGGRYGDLLEFTGTTIPTIRPTDGRIGFFLAAIERDGRARWLRSRAPGPFAVDPEGRLAVGERDFVNGCGDAVAKWDLAGNVLWRRALAHCDAEAIAHVFDVAVAPDHGIWVQGDARPAFDGGAGVFDVGTGVLTPSGSDWFMARLAP